MKRLKSIPFNKPYLTGKETKYISQAVKSGKISGDGLFTKRCHQFLEERYGFKKVLLTTSCTTALEMAAILIDTKLGDEIIMPSFTFVSTANAFVLRGAKIVFADSDPLNPNIHINSIESLITNKTKAIVVVHYSGIACNMDAIMRIAHKHHLVVIEDAAQAIDNYYINSNGNKQALGSIGHLATFSFHETKNISSGEGGMLVINDERYITRSEIIWEKGTNRSAFFRGEINQYGWVDIGSSFLPSEIIAAYLWAQLENIDSIQRKRLEIWEKYYHELLTLEKKGIANLPRVPAYSTNNAHIFYLVFESRGLREKYIQHLKEHQIQAVFHYQSLHKSSYYQTHYTGPSLPMSDRYSDTLLRLPLFYELSARDVQFIIDIIKKADLIADTK